VLSVNINLVLPCLCENPSHESESTEQTRSRELELGYSYSNIGDRLSNNLKFNKAITYYRSGSLRLRTHPIGFRATFIFVFPSLSNHYPYVFFLHIWDLFRFEPAFGHLLHQLRSLDSISAANAAALKSPSILP
jgi:hypothetical protein